MPTPKTRMTIKQQILKAIEMQNPKKHTEDCIEANDDTSVFKGECICPKPAAMHTPTPWRTLPGHVGIYSQVPNGCLIADCGPTVYERNEQEANAAYIVRAVNSHAELLEALKQLANITNRHGKNLVINQIVNQAWDAISKAEGK